MDFYREQSPYCYIHPKEMIVGICALCLKERLLILASKQGHHHLQAHKSTHRSFTVLGRRPIITLPRVFALGSFLHRLESKRQRPHDTDSDQGSIGSLEDSFISIKFEDNGSALWDNKRSGASIRPSSENIRGRIACDQGLKGSKGGRSLVEQTKALGTLRWRKRIGQLLQLARWKRSSKAGVSHVAESVKGRRGWIRNLTRRKTTSTTG